MVDPNAVASCALRHYDDVLGRAGKPTPETEWTVYAAIVASQLRREEIDATSALQQTNTTTTTHSSSSSSTTERHDDYTYWVVTCATGSKCTAVGPEGWVVRDGHAEVLCRRGLVRELWQELSTKSDDYKQDDKSPRRVSRRLLEPIVVHKAVASETTTTKRMFQLRPDVSLHLYISDSPCGDASIYTLPNQGLQFTGAKKVVLSSTDKKEEGEFLCHDELKDPPPVRMSDGLLVREPEAQALGVLRTKSGRSNLPEHLRCHSMACSDKLLRWSLLGLQGENQHMLDRVSRIHLSSICVSRDPRVVSTEIQRTALKRALVDRARTTLGELRDRTDLTSQQRQFVDEMEARIPSVHVVHSSFPCGKTATEARFTPQEADNKPIKPLVDTDATSAQRKRPIEQSESSAKRRKIAPSPCGVSLNWQQSAPDETEQVVGARGIRQGKKPRSTSDFQQLSSRLSRARLMGLAGGNGQYRPWKSQRDAGNLRLRNLVKSTRTFQGWIVKKGNFTLEESPL